MATILSVVQDFCKRQNLTVPATVYGSTDQIVLQVLGLLEEEGVDLAARYSWTGLINEASLTTVATASQGTLDSIATNGFKRILNDTIWSRTTSLPVCGPVSPRYWQAMKALANTGPRYQYRIRQGSLYVTPTPTAGESWYFEYVSRNWISDSTGASFYDRFDADTDIILLPDNLVLQGLRWRWKKEKGFDYAEDFRTYEIQVKNAMGSDGGKPVLHQDRAGPGEPKPGVFVPEGSWNL